MGATDWKPHRLDELGFVGRGKSRHRPRNDERLYGGQYPFIQTADIMAADPYITSYSQTYSEFGFQQSKMWPRDTLCMTIAGANTAKTAILKIEACFPDSVVGFIPDKAKADLHFVKHALDLMKHRFLAVTRGATQDNLSLDKLLSFPLLAPGVNEQRRIGAVFAAYDDLIENNTRRIQVLERMAQALYREWFVHFRFPGHAQVPRVASPLGPIPQGWEAGKLGDHLIALETGKRPKGGVGDLSNGVPSIGAENIKGIGRHDFTSEKYVSREFFEQMRKGVVQDRDVAIYKDGAYIGRSSYFRDGFPHRECCVNEHVFLLRASGHRLTQNMLYLWLQEPDTVHSIRGTNANAAQPGINQQSVNGLGLVIPPAEIASEFDRVVEPLLAGIINCAKRNQLLRRTRDLLLPKLISGALDVSKLDLETA